VSDDVVIRPLATADLADYKRLRDAMLAAHPEAFTSDAESEADKEPLDYLQRLGLDRDDRGHFVLGAWRETRLVEASDIKQLELVKYAPVIFQEYIDGVDLRITVIGDAFFAAEIDARQTRYPVDMRMVVGEALVQPVTLSPDLQARLLALQRRLNLAYGAIDMRRTPAGDYYFLEVNPAGQWAFVEERTQLPITKAMADLLASLDHPI